jgi:thiamine biosynthesis lipoprotein
MSISPAALAGLGGLAAIAAAIPVQAATPVETPVWRLHDDHVLGTSLDVTVVAGTRAGATAAATAARAEIDRLDAILSGWREDSELSALNVADERVVSPELFALLRQAEDWRVRTGGAFDGRLGAASAAWRAGQSGDARLVRASLALDPATRRVARPDGMKIDLDGFAKGHIIDRAVAAARAASPDVKGVMIDIGGDLRCWGASPGGEDWRVGVADACETADNAAPAQILNLKSGAVAFSGRGMRDLLVDGERAGHLLDPATGRPATTTLGACVVAPKAADADALSTAFSVMEPRAAMAMADRLPGVEALVYAADGRRYASAGWRTLADTRGGQEAQLIRVQNGGGWPKGFEVAIGYEIPKISVGNYRAPYVAVWITDENKQLVRVVTLLGDNAKWIPDNYVFWRRYGRKAAGVEGTARPTRAPGKYSLVWDGKDQAGKPVAQGKYTIHVEAVREHGGHSYVSSDLELRAAPVTAQIAGKDELGGVTLRYGKKK